MEPYLIAAVSGLSGVIIGIIIGYYKSKSEFQEQLNHKMDYASCSTCDLRNTVAAQGMELKSGESDFREIRAELSKINTNIALLAQRLETRGYKDERKPIA
jgi:hypothetical protein